MTTLFNEPNPYDMTIKELHLDKIEIGMEIVTIFPTPKGYKYGKIEVVSDYSDTHKQWRLCIPENKKHFGLLPIDGKGYYAMHARKEPHFYYSANPKHIKVAKKSHIRAKKSEELKNNESRRKLKEFKEKLNILMNEYSVSIEPIQLSGDDQGVEMGLCISTYSQSFVVESPFDFS